MTCANGHAAPHRIAAGQNVGERSTATKATTYRDLRKTWAHEIVWVGGGLLDDSFGPLRADLAGRGVDHRRASLGEEFSATLLSRP